MVPLPRFSSRSWHIRAKVYCPSSQLVFHNSKTVLRESSMRRFRSLIVSYILGLFVPFTVFRTVGGIISCSVLIVCYLHCLE